MIWLRRAIVALVVATAIALPLIVLTSKDVASCVERRRQYDALHKVIVAQNTPQKPSELILRAFPQFRPFYEPGNPSYDEAQRLARERRDAVLDVLGGRPSC